MLKRFFKVLLLSKNQNEIELNGKQISISKKEKKLARLGQSTAEFIPLFVVILVMSDPTQFLQFNFASVLGFLIVTIMIILCFIVGLCFAFVIYWLGMRKDLK